MSIERFVVFFFLAIFFYQTLLASETHLHGHKIFHAFWLELESGDGKKGSVFSWDFDGWVGGDDHKLWLKSEGGYKKNELEEAEFWTLYSRNVATFWDFQVGVRQDMKPRSVTYMVLGFEGLAPYFLETQAHLFVSKDSHVSARLKQGVLVLITQKLGTKPYYEINAFAQDVSKLYIGRGFSSGEIGLQLHYEITREVTPYIDFHYERKFGNTASLSRRSGKGIDDRIFSIGLKLMF